LRSALSADECGDRRGHADRATRTSTRSRLDQARDHPLDSWAISIHTVTAFLYSGLPGRSYWLTAILAPRFLASAFASGPALLILLCLALRKLTGFDAGWEAIQKLAVIVAYALAINIFLILAEVFTAFYSGIPEHEEAFRYLFVGFNGDYHLVPWMWLSALLSWVALTLLLVRSGETTSACWRCMCGYFRFDLAGQGTRADRWRLHAFAARGGHALCAHATRVNDCPWIWAVGALMITVFYKTTLSVWEEN